VRNKRGLTWGLVWRKAAALSICLMLANSAEAQVIFQREKLVIAPPPITKVIKTVSEEDAKKEADPAPSTPRRPARTFMVEVRGEDALQLEYIHTMNDLREGDGVLIAFYLPSISPLPVFRVYSPVDVLFLGDDGEVMQIAPNIVPAEITQEITASGPVRGFLYIKAGEAKRLNLRPGDIASHATFNAKPLVIQ
jgi:uncharacterized membrane protein (UPF0127 family)